MEFIINFLSICGTYSNLVCYIIFGFQNDDDDRKRKKEWYGMVGHFLTQCSTNFTSMGRLCGHLHSQKIIYTL